MMHVRPAAERGRSDAGWLDSRHTFSFADYQDPRHMGFRALRVINDDRVAPGAGFPRHPHRDMEIVSYVLDGALEHKDSMGNGGVIRPGEVQRMSAGPGVLHSEYNASRTEPVHFLQIWIIPEARGLPSGYEQKAFADAALRNGLCPVASRDGRDGSVRVQQDATILSARLDDGAEVVHTPAAGRYTWVHVARGRLTVAGRDLAEGDGAGIVGETTLVLRGVAGAEVLVFDLA